MGIIRAFSGALSGTLADQWKDIVTAGAFTEQTVVVPGMLQQTNRGHGSNQYGSNGVITSGSKIYVPENTAAFIFNRAGIEAVISEPGGYVYTDGQKSVFSEGELLRPIVDQVMERFQYGGQAEATTYVAFINLREIRNIKFGTRGPMMYNDLFYGTDLEIQSFGTFSLKVTDPVTFVRNFVPANTLSYSFSEPRAREQILAEFLQSYMAAINSLSGTYRISQLPGHVNEIAEVISAESTHAGSWESRFGFRICGIGIQNIEFSEDSKELVNKYSENKMSLKAYDDVSERASNISAQQKIAEGIQENGFGDGGAGLIFGMNMAQSLTPQAGVRSAAPSPGIDEQIEQLKKMKELLDAGILTQEEFDIKKKEIMGL